MAYNKEDFFPWLHSDDERPTWVYQIITDLISEWTKLKTDNRDFKKETTKDIEVVKTDTAAQVEAVKTDTAAQVEAVKTDTAAQVEAVKTDTAAQVEAVKTDTAAQVEAVKTDTAAQVEAVKTDTAAQVQSVPGNIFPIDSIYTTSSNNAPNFITGATWELIDKKWKNVIYTSGIVTISNNNFSLNSQRFNVHDNDIKCRLSILSKLAMSSAPSAAIGKIDITTLGAATTFSEIYAVGYISSNGGTIGIRVDASGNIYIASASSVAANRNIYVNFTLSADGQNDKADSKCDRFIYKRTN